MRNLKRALSLALASVMVLGMTVVGTGASYTDVTSKQNQEAIEVLQAVGIMVGDDNGNFNPDQKVTRNEMAVVMSNLMDYRAATYAGTSPFTDVPSWAEPYVAACWTNGITSGYTKTTYGGSDSVTTSQAALMLMKALGYFQYSSDFGTDWQFSTIKQAHKIDLFDDVDSGVRDAMTRNDLAQLVLNTLEAGTVEAEKDGQDIEVNGVTISSNVKYNYITSGKSYAYAINNKLNTNNNGTQSSGSIVELGEKLYNGDLKKNDNGDNFNRPGSAWTYKSTEIGKYADSADGEWTAKVSNKALYDAVGTDAYDNYVWAVYQNGSVIAADDATYDRDGNVTSNDNAGRRVAFGNKNKTTSDRVLTSGEGVLTQVFVDNTDKTVVLSLIDTGVAKVTKVTEDTAKGNYEITVNFKTRVPVKGTDSNGNIVARYSALTPETKFTTDTKFAKDDIVVYTASWKSGEIETMAVAKTVAGKVSAQKNSDYTTIDGTKYVYNYAYTAILADGGFGNTTVENGQTVKHTGLYNLEDGAPNGNPAIDKDATLYLDANGYAVAYEGKSSTAEDYLFVKGVDTAFTNDISAKVVLFDGTKKTVDIDQFNNTDADGNNQPDAEMVYKYTAGSSDYDLEAVPADKLVKGTATEGQGAAEHGKVSISNKTPSITMTDADTNVTTTVTTDSQTVFVDAENNKTWTGYKNVSNKDNAKAIAVLNKDGVADIVFIFGKNISSSANKDDFVILKGLGMEAVKDANKKTVYKFTDAYDVNGNKRDDLYAASSSVVDNAVDVNGNRIASAVKGLYLIKTYSSDDYVTSMALCTPVVGNIGDNQSVDVYASAAKNGVLTLNKQISLDMTGGKLKQTFAYDSKTTVVVIEQKQSINGAAADVDTLRVGDINDIVSYTDKTMGATKSNLTGVYVMTVDNDADTTPLAETILVIVPYVD